MALFSRTLICAGDAYAGIGSRDTPPGVLALMTEIARALDQAGMILRSGGADGADNAFAKGARVGHRELFTPWKTFQPKEGPFLPDTIPLAGSPFELPAMKIASIYHPSWDVPEGKPGFLSPGARRLHARNCQQILGRDLGSLSRFVLCWTKNAAGGGGTGQALRIARGHGVPVFDLAEPAILASVLAAIRPAASADAMSEAEV